MKNFSDYGKTLQTFTFYAAFLAVIFLVQETNAATRTWDGGGATNNWSDSANWSGDVAPTIADDVVFDGTSTKNSNIDAPFTVNSVSVGGGFTGTITQNAAFTVTNAFTQSAGIFQGTAVNATFGSLNLSAAAVFNAPSGTLTLNAQTYAFILQKDASAVFNANGGTVEAKGASPNFPFGGTATITFNNLTISTNTLVYGPFVVNGTLTIGSNSSMSGGVPVIANGNVVFANDADGVSGNTEIHFSDTATRTATISGAIIGQPILINNPNITVTTGGAAGETINWTKKVTLQAGTLNQSAANYLFNTFGSFNNPGFNVTGGTFNGSAGNAIFNTTIGISGGNLNAGSGEFGTNSPNCSNIYFQQSGGNFTGSSGNARFCDLRRTGGNFTAPSGNMTILSYGDFTGGTFSANNGTLIVGNNVTIVAPGFLLNNVTLEGTNGHGFAGTPKPQINGTFNLAEGQFSSGEVAANGDVVYGANFTGGGGRLFFEGSATRTINLPARNVLLGMTLDNPNITVTTSSAGASSFTGEVEVKRGLLQQGNAVLNIAPHILRVSGGMFQGNSAALNISSLSVSGGTFSGGSGLIAGGFGTSINQSGGTFSSVGDVELTTFNLSGGTFNAPSGTMTVAADWNHTSGGAFNAGTGTVKFTGYNTFNCINQIALDVNVTETFNNLTLANSFCNVRYVATGDTLIVNGEFRISYGGIGGGGRIRPLGTTIIDATNTSPGGPIVEYITPNTNFVINNPSSTVGMFPVEMNAVNSTLTNSGAGRISFSAMNLINGTVNQGAGIWDIVNPGYSQSGGIFNGSAADLNISNGTGNPMISGGTFNGGTGKITSSFRMTGGTFSTQGDLDTSIFTLEGGTFNAPSGTMKFTGGNGNCYFTHTAGGTFNAGTGTVEIQQGICGFDVNVSENFNNLRFNGNFNIISGTDTLIVNGAMTFNGGGGANGGSIVANGDIFYTNGGGNGNTVVKIIDSATRTLNLNTSNASYNALATLVDNPNATVNFGTLSNASARFNAITLANGTINQGDGQTVITNLYAQSGGTYNVGNYAASNSPATSFEGNFTLSGGSFNAGSLTNFGANYTHTAGGAFNFGTGTVNFSGLGGTIDVNTNENFNNLRFEQASTGTTKTIASGDTLTANGNLEFRAGYVSGGTIDVKGNVAVFPQASGGSTNLLFSGATDQTYTNTGGITINGTWTVNKPNSISSIENSFAPAAPTNLLLSGNIGNNLSATLVPLDIVSGNVVQTGNYNHSLAWLTVSPAASFVNEFGGSVTLGGDVTNNGIIRLNANGAGCQADSIALRSTNATQRAWNGNGYFLMTDVDVSGQSGTPIINVYNGTNSGNNGANWVFDPSCFAPTSANISIGGKVLNANGKGIANVRVVLTDTNGLARVAVTNAFGNYKFDEVAAGQTVTLSVNSKKFTFVNPTQVLNVSENANDVNFTAEER